MQHVCSQCKWRASNLPGSGDAKTGTEPAALWVLVAPGGKAGLFRASH